MQIRDHGELQFVMWKPGAQRELGIVNGKRMRLPPSCDADSAAQQDAETQPAEQPGPRTGVPQLKKQQKQCGNRQENQRAQGQSLNELRRAQR